MAHACTHEIIPFSHSALLTGFWLGCSAQTATSGFVTPAFTHTLLRSLRQVLMSSREERAWTFSLLFEETWTTRGKTFFLGSQLQLLIGG